MKHWKIFLSGLIFILGTIACNPTEFPVATSAGFANPEISATPENIPTSPTPTIIIAPTDSPITTIIPTVSPTHPHPISPTPSPEIISACWEDSGRIEEGQLESELMDDPLDFLVYLPPCYDELPERYFPTLYLFHGQTYTNEHWIDLGITDLVDRLVVNQELAPFVIVFPYDQNHYKPPPENLFGETVFFDLIPTIDRNYRTFPDREYRAIGGISRGGNWAIHIGLPHPGFFGAIGAHSTPIFSTDTNKDIQEWLTAIPFDELPRLFVDTGENDRWLSYTLTFEELLNEEGIPHEWHLYPGFHEDKYWQSHLEEYIRWYADPWSGKEGG